MTTMPRARRSDPRHTSPPTSRFSGLLVALVGLALLAAACGGGDNGSASAAPTAPRPAASSGSTAVASGGGGATMSGAGAATLAVTDDADLGPILVDGQGRVVYLFEKDGSGQSSCSDACAAVWPPVTSTGAPQATGEATSSLVGTISRSDGTTQLTYGGHPLYYYEGDTKPGDTHGQGLDQFGAEWYVLSPGGDKVEKGQS